MTRNECQAIRRFAKDLAQCNASCLMSFCLHQDAVKNHDTKSTWVGPNKAFVHFSQKRYSCEVKCPFLVLPQKIAKHDCDQAAEII